MSIRTLKPRLHIPDWVTLNRISEAFTLAAEKGVQNLVSIYSPLNVIWAQPISGCGLNLVYIAWVTNQVSVFTCNQVSLNGFRTQVKHLMCLKWRDHKMQKIMTPSNFDESYGRYK